MDFKQLRDSISNRFKEMTNKGQLFVVDVEREKLWDKYINNFKPKDDPIFRDPHSTSHTCNADRYFLMNYGNIVSVTPEGDILTLFDIDIDENSKYYTSIKELQKYVSSRPIKNIFATIIESPSNVNDYEILPDNSVRLGKYHSLKRYTKEEANKFGVVKPNELIEFLHFYINVPKEYIVNSTSGNFYGDIETSFNLLKRGLDEISLDTLNVVQELIQQKSLLNGESYLEKIIGFRQLKEQWDGNINKLWLQIGKFPYARFKNELIGVLCTDIEKDGDLEKACLDWNKRVDPVNYMKAQKPITESQKKQAQQFIEENGYIESFDRRFATLDDIKVEEIYHINSDNKVKKVSIFDNIVIKDKSEIDIKDLSKFKSVSIDEFMNKLPEISSVEAYLENRLANNLVAITKASVDSSKNIFKWNNNYSYTFNGDLSTKSEIAQKIKDLGGDVEGILNFRLAWNFDGNDESDLDLHAITPAGEIYYNNKSNSTGGKLDIDILHPKHKELAVENITWSDSKKMQNGIYKMYVRNFTNRNNVGFKCEISLEGNIYQYEYNKRVTDDIYVAEVTYKNGIFSIKHLLPVTEQNKNVWNLDTNKFHKVNLVCLSPNYWGDNNVGNKHYMFMLEGCSPTTALRSFHNENLHSDLLPHRKVMDVLSAVTRIEPTKECLAGLGFNSTVNNNLIVRITTKEGKKQIINLKF